MSGPFKMKGSPMKRNFGIGASPAKDVTDRPHGYTEGGVHKHRTKGEKSEDRERTRVKHGKNPVPENRSGIVGG